MMPWTLPVLWTLAMGAWGAAHRAHRRRLARVPIRVIVGGTRGKTTLVRLLTEALRRSGHEVCARVTGRSPEETLAGARLREPIPWRASPRPGPSDPDEIRRWLRVVTRRVQPSALVVENSAITPESMWAVGHHLFPPTLAVITDATLDHLDLWPPDRDSVARIHVEAIPAHVPVVTSDAAVVAAARRRGQTVIETDAAVDHSDLPAWMSAHLSLIETALRALRINVSSHLRRSLAETARALLPHPVPLSESAQFIDLFDANDPTSAARVLGEMPPSMRSHRTVALFAHRRDRSWRWPMFRAWLTETFDAAVRFERWPDERVAAALQSADERTLFVGVGNAVGPAQGLLAALAAEAKA